MSKGHITALIGYLFFATFIGGLIYEETLPPKTPEQIKWGKYDTCLTVNITNNRDISPCQMIIKP